MSKVIKAMIAGSPNQEVVIAADKIESIKDLMEGTALVTMGSGSTITVVNTNNSVTEEWYASTGVTAPVEEVEPDVPIGAKPKALTPVAVTPK